MLVGVVWCRYDRQRKVFLTVVEQRHPLYRQLNELVRAKQDWLAERFTRLTG